MAIDLRKMDELSREHSRQVPVPSLVKGTAIIVVAPLIVFTVLVIRGEMAILSAAYGLSMVFLLAVLFIRPYLANLSALADYVNKLALDKRVKPPDLTFLNNVQELANSITRLHDSWEQKKELLEANAAENRILIDSLPDILIMLDSELKLVKCNSTARTAFGGKYFDRTVQDIISDPEVEYIVESVLSSKKERSVEFYLPEPVNRHYILRVGLFPTHSTQGIAVIIFMHDITEQKNTEQLLADFVANASHEIRTPLTSVMGLIETLQTTAKDDPEASNEFLRVMEKQAERMAKLVKDLLTLSQIEKNAHLRPTEVINISPVVKKVAEQMEVSARENNIDIVVDIDDYLPQIIGDRSEIARVFENLVSNAIKYGRNGSRIHVDVRVIDNDHVEFAQAGGKSGDRRISEFDKLISIEISDESDGIPPEHLPRLTERFYRVDTARARKVGGTGLGLSIVKHIIDRHHGALKIESTLGKGSCFTVLLPVI